MRVRPLILAATALATAATVVVGPSAPAQAATADRWGFAYVDNPTVPAWTVLDPAHQAGTWPAGLQATGAKVGPGRFLVRFPAIGAGSRGIVHITPVNRDGTYCEAVRWAQSGVDELVDVQCHRPGGAPADTRFTALWTMSSGILPLGGPGSHAYIQYGSLGIVQGYNSTGGGLSVTPLALGHYEVKLGGVGTFAGLSGNLQVTAVQPNAQPRRCKVGKWGASGTDIVAYVDCYNQAGAPIASEFTLSYHRERAVIGSFGPPKYFGYVWSPAGGLTNFNYPAGGYNFNGVGPIAPLGRYLVKYPFLNFNPNHAQITAYGSGSNYCHLTQLWIPSGTDVAVDVLCFDNTGAFAPHQFFSTFTNAS